MFFTYVCSKLRLVFADKAECLDGFSGRVEDDLIDLMRQRLCRSQPKSLEKQSPCVHQKMPQTMQTNWFFMIFLCFPGQNDEDIVGKKHGSIDCLLYHSPVSPFWVSLKVNG